MKWLLALAVIVIIFWFVVHEKGWLQRLGSSGKRNRDKEIRKLVASRPAVTTTESFARRQELMAMAAAELSSRSPRFNTVSQGDIGRFYAHLKMLVDIDPEATMAFIPLLDKLDERKTLLKAARGRATDKRGLAIIATGFDAIDRIVLNAIQRAEALQGRNRTSRTNPQIPEVVSGLIRELEEGTKNPDPGEPSSENPNLPTKEPEAHAK